MEHLLTESSDFDWLFSTHLQAYDNLRERVVIAHITGNEDSPERVELFSVNHYLAVPYAVFTQNEQGNLVQEV